MSAAKTASKIKLYRVHSTIDRWPHRRARYDGVLVSWLIDRDEPPLPWRDLLDGYEQIVDEERRENTGRGWWTEEEARRYAGAYARSLAEVFTEQEAAQLAAYLKRVHGQDVTLEEVPVPVPTRSADGYPLMGLSAGVFGGGTDLHLLYREDGYDLPFQVSGYYSIDYDEPRLSQVLCRHECDGHEHWIDAPPRPEPAPVADGEPPF